MKIVGIIPARYASTRFPGKPLTVIMGKSMIQRVYDQASKANLLSRVIVATDDQRIFDHVRLFGGEVLMTSTRHNTGTERCNEVILNIDENIEVVINIQGDEPFIHPQQIDSLAEVFKNSEVKIATLYKSITDKDELFNPNSVKVVIDKKSEAVYFSRHPLPYLRGKEESEWLFNHEYFKHIGIYAYRTDILKEIVKLLPSPLETAESLEQLRWLENGYTIFMKKTLLEAISIDSPEDLLKIDPSIQIENEF